MAGDHGVGHAEVESSAVEAGELRDGLEETILWLTDDDSEPDGAPATGDGSSGGSGAGDDSD